MTNVTVFGASGFIGRHLVQRLARKGMRVKAAVRRTQRGNFLVPMGDVGQVVPIGADITDDASVAMAITGADAVVNLVGILYERGRYGFDAVHAEGAEIVAKAAAAAGVQRLVQLSAIGADAELAMAELGHLLAGKVQEAVAVVGHDEVVARPAHLHEIQSHGRGG